MADFEVHIALDGRTRPIGLARSVRVRGSETALFEYDDAWLADADRFSLEPALQLGRGAFAPPGGAPLFGSIGDSAPDTWGRRLIRRVVFNVLVSDVDDHLRNHGFLWRGKAGWTLSPAYDLNPVPIDLKARVLATNIDLDEGTCSLDLLESASEYFALTLPEARAIVREVARDRDVARDGASARGASGRDRAHGPRVRTRRSAARARLVSRLSPTASTAAPASPAPSATAARASCG